MMGNFDMRFSPSSTTILPLSSYLKVLPCHISGLTGNSPYIILIILESRYTKVSVFSSPFLISILGGKLTYYSKYELILIFPK